MIESDAEKWLAKFHNGEIDPPDFIDGIEFRDGSKVRWNGMKWVLNDA